MIYYICNIIHTILYIFSVNMINIHFNKILIKTSVEFFLSPLIKNFFERVLQWQIISIRFSENRSFLIYFYTNRFPFFFSIQNRLRNRFFSKKSPITSIIWIWHFRKHNKMFNSFGPEDENKVVRSIFHCENE